MLLGKTTYDIAIKSRKLMVSKQFPMKLEEELSSVFLSSMWFFSELSGIVELDNVMCSEERQSKNNWQESKRFKQCKIYNDLFAYLMAFSFYLEIKSCSNYNSKNACIMVKIDNIIETIEYKKMNGIVSG